MILVFVNERGYYISGGGVESTRRCSPALTTEGTPIFSPIHHTYKVLFLALQEIKELASKNDVIVYNDSRIIDELNGYIDPLDETCKEWARVIRQDVVPSIVSIVIFRKKPTDYIQDSIKAAHDKMISPLGEQQKERMIALQEKTYKQKAIEKIEKLKRNWFTGDNNDK